MERDLTVGVPPAPPPLLQNPAFTMMFFTGLIAATEEALSANEIRDVVKLLNQLRNAKIKENSVSKKKKGKKKTRGAKVRCPPLTSLPACPHAWVLALLCTGLRVV